MSAIDITTEIHNIWSLHLGNSRDKDEMIIQKECISGSPWLCTKQNGTLLHRTRRLYVVHLFIDFQLAYDLAALTNIFQIRLLAISTSYIFSSKIFLSKECKKIPLYFSQLLSSCVAHSLKPKENSFIPIQGKYKSLYICAALKTQLSNTQTPELELWVNRISLVLYFYCLAAFGKMLPDRTPH